MWRGRRRARRVLDEALRLAGAGTVRAQLSGEGARYEAGGAPPWLDVQPREKPGPFLITGDPAFDAAAAVLFHEADGARLRALLDGEVRDAVRRLFEGASSWRSARIRGGTISLGVRGAPPVVERAVRDVQLVAAAAALLASSAVEETSARLRRVALGDRHAEVRRGALRALVRHDREAALAVAREAIGDVDLVVRALAAEQLGAEGYPALREVLAAVEVPEALAVAALALARDPLAEPRLVALLSHRHVAVQIAAARALATCASVAAVEPLLPLTKGRVDRELKQAAREAVEAIQSRLAGVGRGRVSLAARAEDGEVELVRGGELELTDPAP